MKSGDVTQGMFQEPKGQQKDILAMAPSPKKTAQLPISNELSNKAWLCRPFISLIKKRLYGFQLADLSLTWM